MNVGDRVTYAGRPYEVVEVRGDLLVIDGVGTVLRDAVTGRRYGRARERATVLATDVQPAAARGEGE